MKECTSCRSRKVQKRECLLTKIGFDTAENKPDVEVWSNGLLALLILSPEEVFALSASFGRLCSQVHSNRQKRLMRNRIPRPIPYRTTCFCYQPANQYRLILNVNSRFHDEVAMCPVPRLTDACEDDLGCVSKDIALNFCWRFASLSTHPERPSVVSLSLFREELLS